MKDYNTIYNMLVNADINFNIGQHNDNAYYINIPANDPYESDILIEFNSDMSLIRIWAP